MKNKKIWIVIGIIVSIIIFSQIFENNILKIMYPRKYNEITTKYAEEYNIDNNLILAVIKSESNFNPNVISHKGAIGLMQLMEETATEVAKKEGIKIEEEKNGLLDPETNINIGTKYLSILIEKYNSIELALIAYNAGIGNVDKWIEKGIIATDGSNIEKVPFKETNRYVRSILRDYKIYKKIVD